MKLTWPISLKIDSTIEQLAPTDLRKTCPIHFFEPQRVRYAQNLKTTRVVYIDDQGRSHYLWPEGIDLPPVKVALGTGIAFNQACEFKREHFYLGPKGIEIDIHLITPDQHELVYQLKASRPWQGFRFAAPPAAAAVCPTAFFVPYLFDFDFVTQPVEFSGRFDDTKLELGSIPIWRRGRRAVLQKAAADSVIVELMPDGAQPLMQGMQEQPVHVQTSDPDASMPHVTNDGRLKRVTAGAEHHQVTLRFTPPLRPTHQIDAPEVVEWELSVAGDPIATGTHRSERDEIGVRVQLDILKGWQGAHGELSIWFLTRMVRFLSTWPKHYNWRGRIFEGDEANEEEQPRFIGYWHNAHPKT